MRYRHLMWVELDSYKRSLFIKYEFKKNLLKSLKKNKNASYYVRYRASYFLSHYPKFSVRTYSLNRCVLTGRSWSVNKRINTDRFSFQRETYSANLPGCGRASW